VEIKMPTKTVPWDSSAALRSNEEIAAYIDAVLEDGDPALIAHALGVVARSKGMSDLAKERGMGRERLQIAFGEELRNESNFRASRGFPPRGLPLDHLEKSGGSASSHPGDGASDGGLRH